MTTVSDRDLFETELHHSDRARAAAARAEASRRQRAKHDAMVAALEQRKRAAKAEQEGRKDRSTMPLPPRTHELVHTAPAAVRQRVQQWERQTAEHKAGIEPETWDAEEVRLVPRLMARLYARRRRLQEERRKRAARVGVCLAFVGLGAGYVVYKVLRFSLEDAASQRRDWLWQRRSKQDSASWWSWPWFGASRSSSSAGKADLWWPPLL